MFTDPYFHQKDALMRDFGEALGYALDDPDFNGSPANNTVQRVATGNISRRPIRLATLDRPMRDSMKGPRSVILRIQAGMHGARLEKALTKNHHANLRPLVPWKFDGEPQIYFSGQHLCVEVAWPKDLHTDNIPLASLYPNTTSGNAAILGYSSAAETVTVGFDDKLNVHLLLAGMTGSGKSTALATIVVQLAHDPRAEFILMDGKDGQGLGPLNGLPGQIGPLATTHSQILNALGWAWDEMRRRNQEADPDYPPLYVVFDEFDEYTKRDKIAGRLTYLIAKQGRVPRVHLLFAVHRPSQDMFLEKGTKGQFSIRLALRVSAYIESAAIIDAPTPRADFLLGVGDAHLVAPGKIERLQMAYPSAAQLRDVTGGEPHIRAWPNFVAGRLDNDADNGSRALAFSNQEALVALAAARSKWGRDKIKRVMKENLGKSMGSNRIDDSLLPYGEELSKLWEKLEEE